MLNTLRGFCLSKLTENIVLSIFHPIESGVDGHVIKILNPVIHKTTDIVLGGKQYKKQLFFEILYDMKR